MMDVPKAATDGGCHSLDVKSKGENMKTRRRIQAGTITQFSGRWYLRYWEKRVENGELKRKRMSHLLGPAEGRERKHPPDDVERAAERFMSNLNNSAIQPEHVSTLSDFVESVYLPWVKQFKRPATAAVQMSKSCQFISATRDIDWQGNSLLRLSIRSCSHSASAGLLRLLRR
jgi:hypothetical protein